MRTPSAISPLTDGENKCYNLNQVNSYYQIFRYFYFGFTPERG